jgi:hypothetical protein
VASFFLLTRISAAHVTFRLSLMPIYHGLRRFKNGRDFKQWTGDDSKSLMKVGASFIQLSCFAYSSQHLV